MSKLEQLATWIDELAQRDSVTGCALVARVGQGDMLYQTGLVEIDPAFLSTVVSSILLIGEKLGHSLDGRDVGYTLVDYGEVVAAIIPCGEETALLLVLDGASGREAVIAAARDVAGRIGVLLGV